MAGRPQLVTEAALQRKDGLEGIIASDVLFGLFRSSIRNLSTGDLILRVTRSQQCAPPVLGGGNLWVPSTNSVLCVSDQGTFTAPTASTVIANVACDAFWCGVDAAGVVLRWLLDSFVVEIAGQVSAPKEPPCLAAKLDEIFGFAGKEVIYMTRDTFTNSPWSGDEPVGAFMTHDNYLVVKGATFHQIVRVELGKVVWHSAEFKAIHVAAMSVCNGFAWFFCSASQQFFRVSLTSGEALQQASMAGRKITAAYGVKKDSEIQFFVVSNTQTSTRCSLVDPKHGSEETLSEHAIADQAFISADKQNIFVALLLRSECNLLSFPYESIK